MRLFSRFFGEDGSCIIRIKCYVDRQVIPEKYGLDVGLREKETGRRVLVICRTPKDREKLDHYLALAEGRVDKTPGLFQRIGKAHLLVCGADCGQMENKLFIDVGSTLSGGYKFVR